MWVERFNPSSQYPHLTKSKMRGEGFEPSQALSYVGLNDARLTAPALPHNKTKKNKCYKFIGICKFLLLVSDKRKLIYLNNQKSLLDYEERMGAAEYFAT